MRSLLPVAGALLLLVGCSAPVRLEGRVVTDAEIRGKGDWTPADQRARDLLEYDRNVVRKGQLTYGPPPAERRSVRMVPMERKLVDLLWIGDTVVPLPRLLGFGGADSAGFGIDLSALLGLDYEPHYHALPEQNALIFLKRNRPPTVIAIDPDKPIRDEVAPDEAYDYLREGLREDLRGLPAPVPAEP